jgi:hypothetical protein
MRPDWPKAEVRLQSNSRKPSMQLVGECSQSTMNNGVVKTLITIYSNKQPEYVLLNLVKERGELKAGKKYRITIKEEE